MRVVEAVAPQIHANDPAYSPPYWDDCNDDMKRWYRYQATAALDAMLDVLAENADEWADYPAEADPIVVAHREIIARKLVNALREDR